MSRRVAAAIWMLVIPLGPTLSATAQEPVPLQTTGARTVVAGAKYSAGGLHRLMLGNGYRDLWTLPVEVPVLDMGRTAGGLTASFRVGGAQTKGLALRGADGKSYTFRAVDKDPSQVLPPELLGTPFEELVQDQISASMPGASVVALPLAAAAGVLQVQDHLVLLPDDARLGDFRGEYAGLLGTFSEYPQAGVDGAPGTFGAVEVLDGRDMLERITAGHDDRVDAEAYLRARLVDLVLGDWDRHINQWRFARIPGHSGWQTVPEDRDQAFSRYEGVVIGMARDREPKFDRFDSEYAPLEGLAWNAREVDRRLLTGLSIDAYRRLAREIQESLDNEVIARAVQQMPDSYREARGAELEHAIRARRDNLPGEAVRFYEFLAPEVDIRSTNEAETVLVELHDGGDVSVTITDFVPGNGGCDTPGPSEPFLYRRFHPEETTDVRLYLGGGEDRVLVRGDKSDRIKVRVIGGAGNNVLCREPGGTSVTFGLGSRDAAGSGQRVADGVWLSPAEPIEEGGTPAARQGSAATAQRDWGSTTYRVPWIGVEPDIGLFIGTGFAWERFGFRQRPYATRHQVRVGASVARLLARIDYSGDFRLENRQAHFTVNALASAIEVINFFGFGNETVEDRDEEFFHVEQRQFTLEPRVVLPAGEHMWFSTGPLLRYVTTELDDGDRAIDRLRPYGSEATGQLGWAFGLSLNSRDAPGMRDLAGSDDVRRLSPGATGPGVTLDLDTRYHAETWGLSEDYATLRGRAAGWARIGDSEALIGARVGGQKNWGRYPYYDAAFLGSQELRGLPRSRFAGDASLHANVGVQIPLSEARLVIPGKIGLTVSAGAGRVWLEGEDSDTWHWTYGGGIWWAPWTMSSAIRLSFAETDEGPSTYLVTGFGF